jgi:hypothetical protein
VKEVMTSMTNSGFFIMPRALIDGQVWPMLEPTHRVVFTTVLGRVNWKQGNWFDGSKLVVIEPGQLITSQERFAALCGRGFTRQKVRTALNRLENAQLINLVTTPAYTLITVLEYELYTTDYYFGNQRDNPVDNHSITNGQPTDNQRITTIESIKAGEALKQEGIHMDTCALEFQEYWNSHGRLPRIKKMTPGRIRALTQAMEDQDFRTGWNEAVEKLSQSGFHTGGGENGWVADVDWFLKEDNWMKCLELASVPDYDDPDVRARAEIERTRKLTAPIRQRLEERDRE